MRSVELRSLRSQIGFIENSLKNQTRAPKSMRVGFEARLSELRQRVQELESRPADIVAEVLVDNDRIRATRGIDIRFGSEMLAGIESVTRMIRQQRETELKAQKKPAALRRAIITAAVSGSFGFQIEEEEATELEGNAVAVSSGITELGEILDRLGGSDEDFNTFLVETPDKVRTEVGKLLATVAERDASLKFNNSFRRVEISSQKVRAASERLAAESSIEILRWRGVILGVLTKRNRRFEAAMLEGEAEEKISGAVDPSVSSEDLDRLQRDLTHKPGIITIKRTVWKYQHRESAVLALAGFKPDDASLPPVPTPTA